MIDISTSAPDAFQAAVLLQARGRMAEAVNCYEQVLRENPRHLEALVNLASALRLTGRPREATERAAQAVGLAPQLGAAHVCLADALRDSGRSVEAEGSYRQALLLDPTLAAAHSNLGVLLLQSDRAAEAMAAFRQAIAIDPDIPSLHHNLGLALDRLGQRGAAIACWRSVLERDPAHPGAHLNLGQALWREGRLEEALPVCQQARALVPNEPAAHINLGNVVRDLGRLDEALACYRQALAIDPRSAMAYSNMGAVHRGAGRLTEAAAAFESAIEADPTFAAAYSNLASVLQDQGRFEEAFGCCRQALAIDPGLVDAQVNLGSALLCLGRVDQAVGVLEKTLRDHPEMAEARFNLSLAFLLLGDYARGWKEYESRWECAGFQPRPAYATAENAWRGESAAGKTLLLYAEQGYGDAIQMIRFAPRLRSARQRVVVACQLSLIDLFRESGVADEVVDWDGPLPQFDLQAALGSLPGLFETTVQAIPRPPYLQADERRAQVWRSRVSGRASINVGLVWAGNPSFRQDARRSLSPAELLSLREVSGVRLFSLQKGFARDDVKGQLAVFGPGISDLSPDLHSFADTAAAIACLDLVITVDTAVAHLAGALGRPVWILLPAVSDWRWFRDRSDSPWYPTARLFRQPRPGGWTPVVTQVAAELSLEVARRRNEAGEHG